MKLQTRVIFILIVILACVFGIGGFPKNVQQLKENLKNRIHMGLDLQGGTHLILQVQVDDAVKITRDQALERLRDELKARNIPYAEIEPRETDSGAIQVKGVPQAKARDVQSLATEQFSDWEFARGAVDPATQALSYNVALKASAAAGIRNQAFDQAMNTVRNRIDQLGVVEPEVTEYGQGNYEMVVQLPGVDDPTRVQEIIQQTALLELKIVRDGPYSTKEAALGAHGGILPLGAELLPGKPESRSDTSTGQAWYLANR